MYIKPECLRRTTVDKRRKDILKIATLINTYTIIYRAIGGVTARLGQTDAHGMELIWGEGLYKIIKFH